MVDGQSDRQRESGVEQAAGYQQEASELDGGLRSGSAGGDVVGCGRRFGAEPGGQPATFNELTAVIDADDGPDATSLLDPETIALYEDHTRNRRRHAG